MESHALHVIEDRPVSNAHSYFIDKGEIYIDKEKRQNYLLILKSGAGFPFLEPKRRSKTHYFIPADRIFI